LGGRASASAAAAPFEAAPPPAEAPVLAIFLLEGVDEGTGLIEGGVV